LKKLNNMLLLKIITPKKLVLEKEVLSVSAPTASGDITVLSRHADLLTLLKEGVITISTDEKDEYLSVGGGYLRTDGKTIEILVSRAYGQDEINEEYTQKAINKAKEVLSQTKDKQERDDALQTMRRSMVDMKLLSKVRRRKKDS